MEVLIEEYGTSIVMLMIGAAVVKLLCYVTTLV